MEYDFIEIGGGDFGFECGCGCCFGVKDVEVYIIRMESCFYSVMFLD